MEEVKGRSWVEQRGLKLWAGMKGHAAGWTGHILHPAHSWVDVSC